MAIANASVLLATNDFGNAPQGRQLIGSSSILVQDGGPGNEFILSVTGDLATVETLLAGTPNGFLAANSGTPTLRTIVGGNGITVLSGTGSGGNPTISQTPFSVQQLFQVSSTTSGSPTYTQVQQLSLVGDGVVLTSTNGGANVIATIAGGGSGTGTVTSVDLTTTSGAGLTLNGSATPVSGVVTWDVELDTTGASNGYILTYTGTNAISFQPAPAGVAWYTVTAGASPNIGGYELLDVGSLQLSNTTLPTTVANMGSVYASSVNAGYLGYNSTQFPNRWVLTSSAIGAENTIPVGNSSGDYTPFAAPTGADGAYQLTATLASSTVTMSWAQAGASAAWYLTNNPASGGNSVDMGTWSWNNVGSLQLSQQPTATAPAAGFGTFYVDDGSQNYPLFASSVLTNRHIVTSPVSSGIYGTQNTILAGNGNDYTALAAPTVADTVLGYNGTDIAWVANTATIFPSGVVTLNAEANNPNPLANDANIGQVNWIFIEDPNVTSANAATTVVIVSGCISLNGVNNSPVKSPFSLVSQQNPDPVNPSGPWGYFIFSSDGGLSEESVSYSVISYGA